MGVLLLASSVVIFTLISIFRLDFILASRFICEREMVGLSMLGICSRPSLVLCSQFRYITSQPQLLCFRDGSISLSLGATQFKSRQQPTLSTHPLRLHFHSFHRARTSGTPLSVSSFGRTGSISGCGPQLNYILITEYRCGC